ncbi:MULTISPECIES: hypothetical protein [unclassified Streptomyces]|uniref:hypothetical protein n=1 Tax=unclassified Streptomyces TaxID=2593676 RepID=UPI002E29FF6D|nr:hypothetical protein [Streptomyces sp. NBC_00223]
MTTHIPDHPAPHKPTLGVPYIATWSAEQVLKPTVVFDPRHGRIAYADEVPADRDSHGALWNRITLRPGQGTPQLGKVHSLRQRRAMRRLLCQVCAGPADLNEHGMLWLLGDYSQDWPNWPDGMATPHPPVCLPCAWKSTRACPHLTTGFAAVRVKQYPVVGVYGGIHDPRNPDQGPVIDEVVGYHHPNIRYTIAHQLVRQLLDCQPVDLNTELANARGHITAT